jgi:hypothetical protein
MVFYFFTSDPPELHCCNASSNSRVFVCLNHLIAEVGAFILAFSSYVCSLCCYCCCWIKTSLWIDDRIVRMQFTRVRFTNIHYDRLFPKYKWKERYAKIIIWHFKPQ